jgi:hypothetical protein
MKKQERLEKKKRKVAALANIIIANEKDKRMKSKKAQTDEDLEEVGENLPLTAEAVI